MDDLLILKKQNFSHLGAGSKYVGEFFLTGITKLSCSMQGKIQMDSSSPLTITHEGRFQGSLHCGDLDVYGHIEGDIFSSGRVTFYPCSTFVGKIHCSNLCIYPGSVIDMQGSTLQSN